MHISFGIKLGLAITVLTVGLTTVSMYYFYTASTALVRRQVAGRLQAIGHTSTFLFDAKTRDSIVKLKAEIDRDTQVSSSELQNLKPGKTLKSLNPQQIQSYHATPEFQQLTQILRKIKQASHDRVEPLQSYYPQKFSEQPDGILAYLLITTPESPDRKILKFISSASPEPEGQKWPGNPIGNLYAPVTAIFSDAFNGEIQMEEEYYADDFYRSITVVVPIKDKNNQVIAVLGLDYLAGSEQDQLKKLTSICLGLIAASIILSALLSFLIAQYLGYPVEQLQIAVQKVRDQSYEVSVDIQRQDEFGTLARLFNEMIQDVRHYASTLTTQNQQLATQTQALEQTVQERTVSLLVANQKLQALATLDGLTNIFNRRYFDEYLGLEWKRAQRCQSSISLILCDIDYFKLYNDTYGHQAGDECLQQVANTIQTCLRRPSDRVARYGGEEFAVILPDTDLQGALEIADQIRMEVKALQISHRMAQTDQGVTISVGVTSIIPTREQELKAWINCADRGLYQAKHNGRDCVSTYCI